MRSSAQRRSQIKFAGKRDATIYLPAATVNRIILK